MSAHASRAGVPKHAPALCEVVSQRYQNLEKLGAGTYGEVFKAIERATGHIVAIKRMRLHTEDEGTPNTAIREVSLLKDLEHPNIVPLRAVIMADNYLHLVFDFVQHDLKCFMDLYFRRQPLPKASVQSLLFQLLNGVAFCHSHGVLHRDLKPQNLLISDSGLLMLADFGLARAFNLPLPAYTHEVVTLWYRAPEILLGSAEYSTPVDVWSVACIFVEMATGHALFTGDSEIDQLFRIFRVLGRPREEDWPGVFSLPYFQATFPNFAPMALADVAPQLCPLGLDLLRRMTVYDPARRISAQAALSHPYFDNLDKRPFRSFEDMYD